MKAELTGRQRARMADLSLLLDVILKTVAGAARREFCRCGVLHQLQARPRACRSSALGATDRASKP